MCAWAAGEVHAGAYSRHPLPMSPCRYTSCAAAAFAIVPTALGAQLLCACTLLPPGCSSCSLPHPCSVDAEEEWSEDEEEGAVLTQGGKLALPLLPGDRLRKADAMPADVMHGIVSGCRCITQSWDAAACLRLEAVLSVPARRPIRRGLMSAAVGLVLSNRQLSSPSTAAPATTCNCSPVRHGALPCLCRPSLRRRSGGARARTTCLKC